MDTYRSVHSKVQHALHTGKLLKPQQCEACGGQQKLSAHHDDYAHPLVVRWLCSTCHRQYHTIQGYARNRQAYKELRIRDLDDTTYQALKVAAARAKHSLNQFILDGLRRAVLDVARTDKAVAAILEEDPTV